MSSSCSEGAERIRGQRLFRGLRIRWRRSLEVVGIQYRCRMEKEAQEMRKATKGRLRNCGLELHPEKTKNPHDQAIGGIAHRQCRLIWLILHQEVSYEERGPAVTKQSKQRRTTKMIRQLRSLGYRIESPNLQQPRPGQASDFRASGNRCS